MYFFKTHVWLPSCLLCQNLGWQMYCQEMYSLHIYILTKVVTHWLYWLLTFSLAWDFVTTHPLRLEVSRCGLIRTSNRIPGCIHRSFTFSTCYKYRKHQKMDLFRFFPNVDFRVVVFYADLFYPRECDWFWCILFEAVND